MRFALSRLSVLALIFAALFGVACNDYPTQSVERCYPDDNACKAFLAEREAAPSKPNVNVGEQVFLTRCASCHGKDGRGGGNKDRGNFRDPEWHKKWTDADLENIVTAGRGMKMPGQRVPKFELASLLAYVRSMPPKPSVKPTASPY